MEDCTISTATGLTRDPAEPLGINSVLGLLGCPAFGLMAQPHLAELAATTQSDRARVVGVSLSYTYYRHPIYPEHPSNFVPLSPEQDRAIARAESSMLPQWMIEQITRIRYPTLWDAVRTVKAKPGDPKNALEIRLAAHANDVLRTSNPHHVPVRAPRSTTNGRISQADLLETTSLTVNGQSHLGRLLDAGPHMLALGARIDSLYLTVVYDTRIAPRVSVEFITRQP